MTMFLNLNPGHRAIVMDDVTFIDAAGLGVLVSLRDQLTEIGATVSVLGATPRAQAVCSRVAERLAGAVVTAQRASAGNEATMSPRPATTRDTHDVHLSARRG